MITGHGDDGYRYDVPIKMNFSSNLTKWIDPTPLVERLRERMPQALGGYPPPQAEGAREALASMLGSKPDEVLITAGATDAIYLVARAFPQRCSYIMQPTFSEYRDACLLANHDVRSMFNFPRNDVLPADAKIVWICTPNNPTGNVLNRYQVQDLIFRHPEVLFVLDLSYNNFTLESVIYPSNIMEYDNVVGIFSLTKRYGIPGLRLGYIVSTPKIIRHLSLRQMPWNCNGLALEAMKCIAEDYDIVPFDVVGCIKETLRLREELISTGILDVWPTQTHFMLCKLRTGNVAALKEYLVWQHGILIRDASNFCGLNDTYFRISTQTPAENDALVEAIKEYSRI